MLPEWPSTSTCSRPWPSFHSATPLGEISSDPSCSFFACLPFLAPFNTPKPLNFLTSVPCGASHSESYPTTCDRNQIKFSRLSFLPSPSHLTSEKPPDWQSRGAWGVEPVSGFVTVLLYTEEGTQGPLAFEGFGSFGFFSASLFTTSLGGSLPGINSFVLAQK